MQGDMTLGEAFGQLIVLVGQAALKWIPGVGVSIASPGGVVPSDIPTVTEAITVPDVVTYLQVASAPGAYDQLFVSWAGLVGISTFLSLLFAWWLFYSLTRVRQIRTLEYARLANYQKSVIAKDVPRTQQRWQRIQEQASGESDAGWRMAILESDIMLNELLDTQGLRGETMADKMRQVNRERFNTIDIAWEAHRARNRVAHEGSAHTLTNREARRIISLYERVFREFEFIA